MGPIIGINLPDCTSTSQMQVYLDRFAENGFDSVEIRIDMFPLIIEGEICRKWVDHLKSELERRPFRYSAHIGVGLDLRSRDGYDLHKKVLFSSIEVCRLLGLQPLTLHYELASRDSEVEERFFQAHREASDYAGERGVGLCVENIEVERFEPVIELLQRLDRDNVRLTLDTGHTFLAARYFHFDFLEAVRSALPWLGHVHLSDNTGRFEELRITDRPRYDALSKGYRREFGRGDLHLPPYFGAIPFDQVFQILEGYRGAYVCEYDSQSFLPFNREVQETLRKKLAGRPRH